MTPIVTPEEMAAIDSISGEPLPVLASRAGIAVARAAIDVMGGCFGRRVVVLVGQGNNGTDGRLAARRLARRGARTVLVEASEAGDILPKADLVIDAAYGTGLRRQWDAPRTSSPVIAVDIPSGVDPVTGCLLGRSMSAQCTVTFAALKPGLLLGEGRCLAGRVEVADIGLDTSSANAWLVTDHDIPEMVPPRPANAHKWQSACWVVAGSRGMEGSAGFVATAAQRAGSGYVRLSTPRDLDIDGPPEAVRWPVDADITLDKSEVDRFSSMVIGPGLGRSPEVASAVRRVVANSRIPLVVDGDGLAAIGQGSVLSGETRPLVLTPHDGEYEYLTGRRPSSDRLSAARAVALSTGAVVALKGPTTVVAGPDGRAFFVSSGDQRLATAGSGDVLAGIIGAFLARGAGPLEAAAAGAHVHGRLLDRLPGTGVLASDLAPELVQTLLTLRVDTSPGVHS